MTLRDEIKPYLTIGGFVGPELVPVGTIRCCDNQVLFSSEYYIQLKLNNELTKEDIFNYFNLIKTCVGSDGQLHRAPDDVTQDEIDDHIGALSTFHEFGLKVPFHLPFKLFRFPQLVYLWLKNKLPSNFLVDFLLLPLTFITALIIAISSHNAPLSDVDSRTLAWLLIRATDDSWLCKAASKIWWERLRNDYGAPNSMKECVSRYFKPGHPLIKYWKD